MDKINIRASLLQQEVFELFRLQLRKDFAMAGCDVEFTNQLPGSFDELKAVLGSQIRKLGTSGASKLPELLYRVDLSEAQVKHYSSKQPNESWEELVAELIIKRLLQKVILKKTYSKK